MNLPIATTSAVKIEKRIDNDWGSSARCVDEGEVLKIASTDTFHFIVHVGQVNIQR